MKWHNISEFPPNDTKTSSKTVIVLKKSGRTMRAYYLFPEKRWILARNGKRMNTKNLIAWRFESVSFLDLEQQHEDEEQAAYLAEWSRRPEDEKKTVHKPKGNEPGADADVRAAESEKSYRCSNKIS